MNEQNFWWNQGKEHPLKGKKHSMETIEKLRIARSKQPMPPRSEATKIKLRESMGKYREHYSELYRGDKTHLWKGGITPINTLIRTSSDFKVWRDAVFIRDNYTCQKCKIHGVQLQAHHIQTFSQNEELRFDIDNGITLCLDCHVLFHKLYSKQNNTRSQVEEFLKEAGL